MHSVEKNASNKMDLTKKLENNSKNSQIKAKKAEKSQKTQISDQKQGNPRLNFLLEDKQTAAFLKCHSRDRRESGVRYGRGSSNCSLLFHF